MWSPLTSAHGVWGLGFTWAWDFGWGISGNVDERIHVSEKGHAVAAFIFLGS